MATTHDALQATGIIPTLTVDDLPKSITFYETLGFTAGQRWEDNGTLVGVMMRAGKTQIGLSQDDWKKGRDRKKGIGVRMILEITQNVDEVAARMKGAGIALVSEPRDTEFQGRAFVVSDPNGFLLTISSVMPA